MKKILFLDNTAHHLYSQSHLYSNFVKHGYNVMLCCPNDGNYFVKLQDLGYACYDIKIDGKGLNPIHELLLLYQLKKLFQRFVPDVILSFTIKPNIYGATIGRLLNIPIVPNITGLGAVFLKNGFLHKLVRIFYKIAFKNLKYIIFQNNDDLSLLSNAGVISLQTKCITIPGSGVNLNKFKFYASSINNNSEDSALLQNTMDDNFLKHAIDTSHTTFLYSGRFLWDKGIGELIAAFKIVKTKYPNTCLKFIGNYYPANPAAISEKQMAIWQHDLGIEYLGMVDNVEEVITSIDCVVLPSYREGTPRAILEASSMGKVVITTDVPGCRGTVDDGVTGFLCKVKDADDLANKMLKFIELPAAARAEMGMAGRKKMEREFDQNIVINKYLEVVKSILI